MNFVKRAIRTAIHASGGLRVVRRRNRNALRILMFHGFPADQSELRGYCEHIRRFYNPVSMAQVAAAIHQRSPLADNAVAITVDDGYRDFLLNGFPAFRDFELPVTVFAVTDFLDRKSWLWWNQIEYAFEHSAKRHVDFDAPGIETGAALETPAQRKGCALSFAEALTHVSNSERLSEMDRILLALEVSVPSVAPPQYEPLTWQEARELSKNNIEFGAHTNSHPILSSIDDLKTLADEICGSKTRIDQELGSPVIHFCYPNGKLRDISAEALRITRECGFETAVTTEQGLNRVNASTDAFLLRRTAVSPGYSMTYFAELLAGLRAG